MLKSEVLTGTSVKWRFRRPNSRDAASQVLSASAGGLRSILISAICSSLPAMPRRWSAASISSCLG